MLRRFAPLLGLLLAMGCAKPPAAPTVHPATSDTVQDGSTPFGVDVGWRQVPPDEVEIVVNMTAKSIEQTENLVLEVSTSGFVITAGTPEWIGFIQPREKYEHKVSYKLLDGEDSGRVTLGLRHSADSTLLWETELLFRKEGSGVVLAE